MPVDTVDNPITYHNFIVAGIGVSPSAFLFVAWSNCFHGVYVKHTAIVSDNLTLARVIFICHNRVSVFNFL